MDDKILIVEDDPFLKEFYEFVFKKINKIIIITEDGDEIFEILNNYPVSLILMDINLKNTSLKGEKIDGICLSRIIKETPKLNHIPILIVSAYYLDKSYRKLFVDSLADDYFIKPITDINFFLSKIKELMQKSCQKIEY